MEQIKKDVQLTENRAAGMNLNDEEREEFELAMVSEKYAQLILHTVGLLLHGADRPTRHGPSQVGHAVLLCEVVIVLLLGNMARQMARVVIDLNSDPLAAALKQKISKAAVIVYVVERVLGVQITGFVCAKYILKQTDEEVLGT